MAKNKAIKKGETDMTAIAQRIIKTPAASPAEMALRIKQEAPTLADLNQEQLEQIARLVMTQRLAAEMNIAVDLAGINWQKERETFLEYTKSPHTRRAYITALNTLENWASRKGINPLEMNAAAADRFIHDMKAEGRAANSIRRDIAAVSAFYSFLDRNTDGKVKNPVRGTKQRPAKKNKADPVVPTTADYKAIIAELPPIDRAIVVTMASRGLRVGALPSLELKGKKYHGKSKGKDLEGITLPPEALEAITAAGLDIKKPFLWETRQGTGNSANAIEARINYHMTKLYKAGKISARYSCHDFRHYFAVQEYEKDKDIVRVSKLLGHSGIQITTDYLKSLNIEL